jgi:CheY-like chemotaxis protein
LARRLVEMHEGRIEIRSLGHGQGAEVEIRLPVTTATEADGVEAEQPSSAATRSLRVLIVDDNLDAAEMLGAVVSRLGHTIRLAHDGAAAVTAAVGFAPDVILLDIGLPVMNGYAVARTLRQWPGFNQVYIAAITGWGEDKDRRQAREVGFDSHFTKPLSPALLQNLLDAIARRAPSAEDAIATPRTRRTDSGSAV